MLCGGVVACHRYGVFTGSMSQVWCVYWQHVMCMVCVLAACDVYGVCTGSMSYVWCVYWQHVIGMVCVLAACHGYGVCKNSQISFNTEITNVGYTCIVLRRRYQQFCHVVTSEVSVRRCNMQRRTSRWQLHTIFCQNSNQLHAVCPTALRLPCAPSFTTFPWIFSFCLVICRWFKSLAV